MMRALHVYALCASWAALGCVAGDAAERDARSDGGVHGGAASDSVVPGAESEPGLVVKPLAGVDAAVADASGDGHPAEHDDLNAALEEQVERDQDAGSDDEEDEEPDPVELPDVVTLDDLPYATSVASYEPGANAGFGEDEYPEIVFGPPIGSGPLKQSLDVLSLGVGGEIVLDFGELEIVDGDGPDLIVFENPFWPGGDETAVFAELGEVSVSADGTTWHTFECDTAGIGDGQYPGCAGWTPTEVFDPLEVYPLDPELTGGDAFDLDELDVPRARFVRIRDLATSGDGITAGFDLDAVGLIHFE